ncbi:family 20 glycosylhydrolase [Demequina sediminicola]|uniref:family 20 glycosylhydrolase n=1 Tax=Demequina sediminicola TaxID=1095026 RepID=UPI000785862D|nr:family 20 glycosylhydrolase [Demequina sediminicola]
MPSIIPQPESVTTPAGASPIHVDGLVLIAGPTATEHRVALQASTLLSADAGVTVPVAEAPEPGAPAVILHLDASAGSTDGHADGYEVNTTTRPMSVRAASAAGLFHGVQTLRQLLTRDADRGVLIEQAVVVDAPRYSWRGLTLDIARNFFPLDILEDVIDVLAAYKFNVLHLHLTDDQGWRIESPSRPELAKFSSDTSNSGKAEGYLTLADFRQLQDYAAERCISVIPEIDMPGHTNAATAIYGELRPDGQPTEKYEGMEVGFSQLTFDLPATAPFIRDVLGDLAGITDAPYLHVGGDEALTLGKQEYAKFITLLEEAVAETGKKVIMWQEAAAAPTQPGTVLQYWDTRADTAPFVAAAQRGSRFIMSPGNHAYLDMKYTADYERGQDWAGLVELRDSYEWDPATLIEGVPGDQVDGVEAAIWTETLSTREQLFDMLLPRLTAVAEVAWTAPERKDWEDYRTRVAAAADGWRRQGLTFHETPQVDWN